MARKPPKPKRPPPPEPVEAIEPSDDFVRAMPFNPYCSRAPQAFDAPPDPAIFERPLAKSKGSWMEQSARGRGARGDGGPPPPPDAPEPAAGALPTAGVPKRPAGYRDAHHHGPPSVPPQRVHQVRDARTGAVFGTVKQTAARFGVLVEAVHHCCRSRACGKPTRCQSVPMEYVPQPWAKPARAAVAPPTTPPPTP